MRLLLIFFLLCVASTAVRAESPPVPDRKTKSLEILKQRVDEEKKEKERLDAEMKNAQSALAVIRKNLKKASGAISKNEQQLVLLEKKIQSLTEEEETIRKRIRSDYGSLSDLAMALRHIGKIPPQALILQPGTPLQTARSAIAMKSAIPVLSRRADTLAQDLAALEKIEASLQEDRRQAEKLRASLHKEYTVIESLGTEKESYYAHLSQDLKETTGRLEQYAREAKTMDQLLEKLRRDPGTNHKSSSRKTLALFPGLGKVRLPVAGTLLRGFGEKDDIGSPSEGIKIESTPAAMVIAPMGGIVRFAGEFKNYGRIVILEHSSGYHSLLAGLETIGVHPGETLEPGEPVGRLPAASSRGGAPALYYELRRNGQPVNPSEKFTELKS